MSANLIKELKNKGEDFEFYPTTREILEAMYWDLVGKKYDESNYRANGKSFNILDVGAGQCKLLSVFEEIANEQPLLGEYHYPEINGAEYYESCKLKKVISLEEYGRRYKIELDKDGSVLEENIHLNQLMIMLKNAKIEDVDLTSLDELYSTHSATTNREILLSQIEKYEIPKNCRSERERYANRIFIKKYMAIEKSQILIDQMPKNVFVVGTDFQENQLIDKNADIVFSNPPYSEYSLWAERIIKEANAKLIYLVIPKRWGKQGNIAAAIKARRATVSIVGDFDFLQSEDRKARAKVSLVKIDLTGKAVENRRGYKVKSDEIRVDPFDLWFNETFKINAKKEEEYDYQIREQKAKNHKEKVENALVNGNDLVSSLVEVYNQELNALVSNYQKLGELDADLLKELNVNIESLLKAFKEKISGLKNLYWQEIFNNLDAITSRLTSRTRESLLNTLTSNTNIDFTTGNIRSVVIWVIKNAESYFNSQMLEVYDDFTTGDGINLYKSNANFNNDTWRYCRSDKKTMGKYALDYRIVCHGYRSEYEWRNENSLSDSQQQYVRDIVIIAKNLGFTIDGYYHEMALKEKHHLTFNPKRETPYKVGTKTLNGKIEEVYCQSHLPNENGEDTMEKDGVIYVYRDDQDSSWFQYKIDGMYINHENIRIEGTDTFTTVRGHGNGNVHFQFNQEFIKKFNLEVGRIRGWIKTPQEAANEFDISIEEANAYWNTSFKVLPSALSNLLPYKKEEVKEATTIVIANELAQEEVSLNIKDAANVALYDEDVKECFLNGTLF